MASCYETDAAVLVTALEAGWTVVSGPYGSQEDCEAGCAESTGTSTAPGSSTATSGYPTVEEDCGCGPNEESTVWRFSMSGIASDPSPAARCVNCEALNGEHLLEYTGKVDGLCFWSKDLGVDPDCGGGGWIELVTDGVFHQIFIFTAYQGLHGEWAYVSYERWNCHGSNVLVANETVDCLNIPPTITLEPLE